MQSPLSAVCFAVPVCWNITVKSQVRLLLLFSRGKGDVLNWQNIFGCSYEKMYYFAIDFNVNFLCEKK